MPKAKTATLDAPEVLPTHGGSYVRQPDGSLEKTESTLSRDEAAELEQATQPEQENN